MSRKHLKYVFVTTMLNNFFVSVNLPLESMKKMPVIVNFVILLSQKAMK